MRRGDPNRKYKEFVSGAIITKSLKELTHIMQFMGHLCCNYVHPNKNSILQSILNCTINL